MLSGVLGSILVYVWDSLSFDTHLVRMDSLM